MKYAMLLLLLATPLYAQDYDMGGEVPGYNDLRYLQELARRNPSSKRILMSTEDDITELDDGTLLERAAREVLSLANRVNQLERSVRDIVSRVDAVERRSGSTQTPAPVYYVKPEPTPYYPPINPNSIHRKDPGFVK